MKYKVDWDEPTPRVIPAGAEGMSFSEAKKLIYTHARETIAEAKKLIDSARKLRKTDVGK